MAHATLREIVDALGGQLIGGGAALAATRIERIEPIDSAGPDAIAFLADRRLAAKLTTTRAGCVIVGEALRPAALAPEQVQGADDRPLIVTADAYLYFARLTQWWQRRVEPASLAGVHPTALVDPAARLGARVAVGPYAVIEAGATIGDDAVIGAHTFIGGDAVVGAATRIAPRVTLHARCTIGARCVVHSGAVIGADGFGYAPTEGRWERIEQLGGVVIGDDVDIGANTCIDRGALGNTVIGNGVKLDNLIQIGHNVQVGDHSAFAGCVGIAGSAVIGKHVTIGGASMIGGHLEIADHVTISGGTVVSHSVKKPGQYTAIFPLAENAVWEKNAATLRTLHRLRDRVRSLERAALPKAASPPVDL